jgi:hypothetical protein
LNDQSGDEQPESKDNHVQIYIQLEPPHADDEIKAVIDKEVGEEKCDPCMSNERLRSLKFRSS